MGRIVVTEFMSLDGVVELPPPNLGDEDMQDSWVFKIPRGKEGDQFKLDETLGSEALLLGRVTYEGFAEAWPSRTDDDGFADKFNAMPKYVVSSTLETADWNNSTIIEGDVVQEVSKLRERLDGDIVVHGSPTLVHTLLDHDLVDELRTMVFPVVAGTGKRLFDSTSGPKYLRLTDSQFVGDGVAILVYERA